VIGFIIGAIVLYFMAGLMFLATLEENNVFESHQNVTASVFWPVVFTYFFIKYIIILIKYILVSIYKTILDINIFSNLKKKIEERSLTPLNSSNGRVISSIKDRHNYEGLV